MPDTTIHGADLVGRQSQSTTMVGAMAGPVSIVIAGSLISFAIMFGPYVNRHVLKNEINLSMVSTENGVLISDGEAVQFCAMAETKGIGSNLYMNGMADLITYKCGYRSPISRNAIDPDAIARLNSGDSAP